MKTKIVKKINFYLGIVAIGLVVGLSVQFVRAWTEPSAAPPGGNVGAPINTSGIAQTKSGLFTAGNLSSNTNLAVTNFAGVGSLSVGDSTNPVLFTVGSGDPFQVDSSGNMIKIRGITYSWPGSQGASGQTLINNGSGTLSWATISDTRCDVSGRCTQVCIGSDCKSSWPSSVGGSGTDNYLARWNGTGSLETSNIFQADTTGNIGIGTGASAGQKLEVNGVAQAATFYASTGVSTFNATVASGTVEANQFCLDDGANCITSWPSSGITGSGTPTQIAYFKTNNTTLASESNLYWDEANDQLIVGSTTGNGRVRIVHQGNGTDTAILQLVDGANSRTWNLLNRDASNIFMIQSFDGASTYRMPFQIELGTPDTTLYIKSDGNVGVGTVPSRKLEVNGNAQAAVFYGSTGVSTYDASTTAGTMEATRFCLDNDNNDATNCVSGSWPGNTPISTGLYGWCSDVHTNVDNWNEMACNGATSPATCSCSGGVCCRCPAGYTIKELGGTRPLAPTGGSTYLDAQVNYSCLKN